MKTNKSLYRCGIALALLTVTSCSLPKEKQTAVLGAVANAAIGRALPGAKIEDVRAIRAGLTALLAKGKDTEANAALAAEIEARVTKLVADGKLKQEDADVISEVIEALIK